jgi:hypothetical protein
MHTHTINSDGNFTLAELCGHARDFLYDAIAVTDHNTMSALDELPPTQIPIIPGIEWTTYYGHMLVLGADTYIDWRFARPETIDRYTQAIKEAHGLVGIAHPFEFGSPLCTGCYWDFKVQDWKAIDYIEVWSNPFPHSKLKNHLAFQWWTKLLNQGHRLAASAGWDWHDLKPPAESSGENTAPLPPATWLGLRDGKTDIAAVREALEGGRSFVTLGPFAEISLVMKNGQRCGLGDTAGTGDGTLSVTVDESRRRPVWASFGIATKTIRLVHNGTVIKELPYSPERNGNNTLTTDLNIGTPAVEPLVRGSPLAGGWLRVEGYGDYLGSEDKLLFFSSPIYIRPRVRR